MTIRSARLGRALAVLAAAAGIATMLSAAAVARDGPCTREDFDAAVDTAGASLRTLNAGAKPKLEQKLKLLQEKKGWDAAGYEERGLEHIQDTRIAALDAEANDLLMKVDELSRHDTGKAPECARLGDLEAAGAELLAVMRAKSDYSLGKLDRELGLVPEAPKVAAAQPPPAKRPAVERKPWETVTSEEPAAQQSPSSVILPPDAFVTDEQGYTIDEIREATRGFFGTISTSLASVIEHAFAKSGRPTAYVLGNEGGGAFLAGVRYGSGTLYLRSGGTQKVYWHGPSIGGDIGASGSRTLFLIYSLKEPEGLFRRFAGVDGSAYVVGGVGLTFLKGGDVFMAPIRSGIGLRLGASIGYVRFTPSPTWNPF